jgi:hypothetical protein
MNNAEYIKLLNWMNDNDKEILKLKIEQLKIIFDILEELAIKSNPKSIKNHQISKKIMKEIYDRIGEKKADELFGL